MNKIKVLKKRTLVRFSPDWVSVSVFSDRFLLFEIIEHKSDQISEIIEHKSDQISEIEHKSDQISEIIEHKSDQISEIEHKMNRMNKFFPQIPSF